MRTGRPPRPTIDRFNEKWIPEPFSGCWLWTEPPDISGYGRLGDGHSGTIKAHRFSYEYFVGPIPKGLTIDHLCRTRCCVNPKHLEPVTDVENVMRGNSPAAVNARKTHCIRGHPLSGKNLLIEAPTGKRQCKICQRFRWRKHQGYKGRAYNKCKS